MGRDQAPEATQRQGGRQRGQVGEVRRPRRRQQAAIVQQPRLVIKERTLSEDQSSLWIRPPAAPPEGPAAKTPDPPRSLPVGSADEAPAPETGLRLHSLSSGAETTPRHVYAGGGGVERHRGTPRSLGFYPRGELSFGPFSGPHPSAPFRPRGD